MLRTLALTLAKGKSRQVPNKNSKEIAGRPLLEWTLIEAKKCNRMTSYFVSTEDFEMSRIANRNGVVVLNRPEALAQDDTPSLDVIKFHVEHLEKSGDRYDAVALIPCTTPLRQAEDIDSAVRMLEDNPMANSVIGVTECLPVERVKKVVDGLIVDTAPEPLDGQRQNLEKCYVRSGIYVIRRDSLDRLFGHPVSLAYVMDKSRGVNIDDELDWILAEALLLGGSK